MDVEPISDRGSKTTLDHPILSKEKRQFSFPLRSSGRLKYAAILGPLTSRYVNDNTTACYTISCISKQCFLLNTILTSNAVLFPI